MIDARPQAGHKPQWLKVRLPSGAAYNRLKDNFRGLKLHTV
ncbi:MAG: lipoyl synthase, partial [Deltaproteobacteria bacterium]|nr:lipoyl synthase [Deltaproteobacteria bacterium]